MERNFRKTLFSCRYIAAIAATMQNAKTPTFYSCDGK